MRLKQKPPVKAWQNPAPGLVYAGKCENGECFVRVTEGSSVLEINYKSFIKMAKTGKGSGPSSSTLERWCHFLGSFDNSVFNPFEGFQYVFF